MHHVGLLHPKKPGKATRGARAAEMGCNIVDSLESATSTPANDDGDNIWVEQYWREKIFTILSSR
jgi:hypothetical protein